MKGSKCLYSLYEEQNNYRSSFAASDSDICMSSSVVAPPIAVANLAKNNTNSKTITQDLQQQQQQ